MDKAKYQIFKDNEKTNNNMQSSLSNIVTFANLHDMKSYGNQKLIYSKNNQKLSGQSSQFIQTLRNSNNEDEEYEVENCYDLMI